MTRPLCIVHLEDDANDALLVSMHLESQYPGCIIRHVKSAAEFDAALDRQDIDLILTDNSGPGFTGHAALTMAATKRPRVPLIVLSGSDAPNPPYPPGISAYVSKNHLNDLTSCITRLLPHRR